MTTERAILKYQLNYTYKKVDVVNKHDPPKKIL